MKRILFAVLLTALGCFGTELACAESAITVSPASLSLKGRAGQTATHDFKLSNFTDVPYVFKIDVADVIVQEGKRNFIPAGQSPGSIAALSVLPVTHVELKPGETATVPVTFALPAETNIRAVAVFFHGYRSSSPYGAKVRLSLGAVVDFSTSDNVMLDLVKPEVTPQTATTNATVIQELVNVGPEPVIIKGVAAILSQQGALVGSAQFEQKRLLPGERNELHAIYAGILPSGRYKVLCSLEYAGKAVTRTTEFVVP